MQNARTLTPTTIAASATFTNRNTAAAQQFDDLRAQREIEIAGRHPRRSFFARVIDAMLTDIG